MKNILILFGGQSSEHKVSCKSVVSVIQNIDTQLFQIYVVGITKKGEWFLTNAAPSAIIDGSWEKDGYNCSCFLASNRAFKGLVVRRGLDWERIDIDCIFPVMHGELCEDGAIQGMFELCGIPYVGPNIAASACSMDKSLTKLVAASSGVRQAAFCVLTKQQIELNLEHAIDVVENKFSAQYPLFVKPASAGSSVGISKVYNRDELVIAFEKASKVCTKVLVEEMITGREVEVAVLGNESPKASVVGEVLAANDFYDYEAKYENSASRTVIPAEIDDVASEKLRDAAIKVYQALGCSVMSRVDFFLLPDGDVVFNEINTLPGFTTISMYPKLWEATGLSYKELLTKLCELAMKRGCLV